MDIKEEEKNALNEKLKLFPNQQYTNDDEDDPITGVDCWVNDEPQHLDVMRVKYPVPDDCGIFLEDEGGCTYEVGARSLNFGEITNIMDNIPESCLEMLNLKCKEIDEKLNHNSKFKGDEYSIVKLDAENIFGKKNEFSYAVRYDGGFLRGFYTLEDARNYLDGLETAVDLYLVND